MLFLIKFKFFWLLSLMWMIRTRINIKVPVYCTTQSVTWEHPFNSHFYHPCRYFFHKFPGSNFSLTSRIACMSGIFFVVPLPAGQPHFLRIDNNHMIPAINMRCIIRLMLASQYIGHLGTQPAQYLIGSIHNIPLFFNGVFIGRNCLIT